MMTDTKADIRERMEITQADRDAAADYSFKHENPVWWLPEAICNGQEDEAPLVQAFARHRQQSTAALLADMQEPEKLGAIANTMANIRRGQRSSPSCEPPSEYDIQWCRDRLKEAIRAIAAHLEKSK